MTLTTGTKGLTKTAYSFDGRASYITVPGGGTMPDNPTCITQALWVKAPHGTPSGGQYAQAILLTKRQTNDGSDWPSISMDQKHVYFGVDDYAYSKVVQSPKPINDSSWHHVVGVKNGTTYSLYVDGRLAAKPLVDAHPTDGSKANYTIANRVWSHFSWFAGSVDNVRVYNRALSAGEIAALYDNEKPAR